MTSASLNRVTLIGHLGADPEIRDLPDGGKFANFSVATTDSWTDKSSGEKKDRTTWTKVVIFNEPLIDSVVGKFLKKGSKIFIEGSLENRKWQDSDNVDRYSTEVVLRPYSGKLTMLDAPKQDAGPARPNGKKRQAQNTPDVA
jgi:single-strand DNA-binding protein